MSPLRSAVWLLLLSACGGGQAPMTPKPQGCPGTLTAVVSNQVGMSLDVLDGTSVIGSVGPRSTARFVVLHRRVWVRQAESQYDRVGEILLLNGTVSLNNRTGSIRYHVRYECAQ